VACKALAADSQGRVLISLSPEKRGPDEPDWRGNCAICIDRLPLWTHEQTFYACCCKTLCTEYSDNCVRSTTTGARSAERRSPSRTPRVCAGCRSTWTSLRRLQKHWTMPRRSCISGAIIALAPMDSRRAPSVLWSCLHSLRRKGMRALSLHWE